MKKLLTLALSCAMAISLSPAAAFADVSTRPSQLTTADTPACLTTQASLTKKVGSRYVGTYKRLVYANQAMSTYAGYLPKGSLYSTSILKISKASNNLVKFTVSYTNANNAGLPLKTKAITARAKNGKASFNYSTGYGEKGKGYLKFRTDGKVTVSMTTTKYAGIQSLNFYKPLTFKKGTQKFKS